MGGHRVAVVDDVISAGSSVRATVAAVTAAGASTVAVGTLLAMGTTAVEHLTSLGLPVEALGQHEFAFWRPGECPHCRTGAPLEDPLRGGPSEAISRW